MVLYPQVKLFLAPPKEPLCLPIPRTSSLLDGALIASSTADALVGRLRKRKTQGNYLLMRLLIVFHLVCGPDSPKNNPQAWREL